MGGSRPIDPKFYCYRVTFTLDAGSAPNLIYIQGAFINNITASAGITLTLGVNDSVQLHVSGAETENAFVLNAGHIAIYGL